MGNWRVCNSALSRLTGGDGHNTTSISLSWLLHVCPGFTHVRRSEEHDLHNNGSPGPSNQPSSYPHAQDLLVVNLGTGLLASSIQPLASSLSLWQRKTGASLSYNMRCICKDPILFNLVSYSDVRVQSNPFILKETSVY